MPRELRRQIYRQLLIGNRVFENTIVGRLQQGYFDLLLLLDKSSQRKFPPQIVVVDMTGKLMGKPIGFKLRPVGENDARLGIGIDFALVIRPRIELLPIFKRLVYGTRLFTKWIHTHSLKNHSIIYMISECRWLQYFRVFVSR